MTLAPSPRILLVEGATERRLIPELMEHRGVLWELPTGGFAVRIDSYGGIERMLAPGEIETALKASGLESLGIIFDADGLHGDAPDRWATMRHRCADVGCTLPEIPPAAGFETMLATGIRFGVWMMPDNTNKGMLETFLLRLVPTASDAIYEFASASVDKARTLGASFRPLQHHKALIYTWLAWQDPPGAQLHDAVKFKILDPSSSSADAFVNWFRTLFRV